MPCANSWNVSGANLGLPARTIGAWDQCINAKLPRDLSTTDSGVVGNEAFAFALGKELTPFFAV